MVPKVLIGFYRLRKFKDGILIGDKRAEMRFPDVYVVDISG